MAIISPPPGSSCNGISAFLNIIENRGGRADAARKQEATKPGNDVAEVGSGVVQGEKGGRRNGWRLRGPGRDGKPWERGGIDRASG